MNFNYKYHSNQDLEYFQQVPHIPTQVSEASPMVSTILTSNTMNHLCLVLADSVDTLIFI